MDEEDIKLNIDPSYLKSFNRAISSAQETYNSFFNSSYFKSLISDTKRIQEIVQSVAKTYAPIIDSLNKQRELVEMVTSYNSYNISSPRLIPSNRHEKRYSEKEVENLDF